MNLDTAIRLTAQVQGANNIRGLAQQFQGLTATSQVSGRQLDKLYTETKKLAAAAGGSINALRQQRTALVTLREAVEPTSRRFQLLTRDVEALDRRLKALNGTQQQVANSQRGMARQAAGSALGTLATGGGVQGAVGALAGGLAFSGSAAGLAAGAGLTAVAAGGALAARVGVDAETAQVRLKALTDQFGEYNQAQAAAARIAGTLRISSIEASDGFSKLYAALRPTGVTLQEIEDAFVGFTAAARVSGATAQESSAALIQLKQALGSGVLQGDELRSLREQAPLAAQAIAREMGVTIGELKKLGSEGQITTDIVLRALAKLKTENLGKLNQQFNTSAQALADLRIATDEFGVSISKVFGPTAVGTLRVFTEAVKGLRDAVELLGNPEDAARNAIRRGRLPWGFNAAGEIFKGSSGVGGVGLTGLQAEARDLARIRRQPYTQVLADLMRNRLDRIENTPDGITSEQTGARAGAAAEREAARRRAAEEAGKAARKEQEKAEKEAQKAAQQALERQIALQERLSDLRLRTEQRVADLMQATNERALQMVQQINDEKLQGERRIKALQAETVGNYADMQLQAEIRRQSAAGMPTEGLEMMLQISQSRRQLDADTIRISQDRDDRLQGLSRQLSEFRSGFTSSLQDIFKQGADQYRDAMQDAARDEDRATRRLDARGVGGGSIRGGARTNRTRDPDAEATGWDIVMPGGRGAPVQAPLALTITGTGFQGRGAGSSGRGYGNWISGEFQLGGKTYELLLGHFDRVDVSPGMQVPAGMSLGTQGITGRTFGTHVTTHVNPKRGASVADAWNALDAVTRIWERGGMAPAAPVLPPAPRPSAMPVAAPVVPTAAIAATPAPGMNNINSAAGGYRDTINQEARVNLDAAVNRALSDNDQRIKEATSELNNQAIAAQQQLENFQKQQSLIRGGLSPEIAQMRVEAERRLEIERMQLQVLETQIIKDQQIVNLTVQQKDSLSIQLKDVRDRLAAQQGILDTMTEEQVQLEKLTRAYEDQKALVEGISGSIGNGLSASLDLLISGTESWGNSLREIASGVLQDIAKQLAQIYIVQPATSGLQGLLGNLLGGGGASAGATAAAGASAYTMPMLSGVPAVTGAFANGGIMTSAGPLPLRAYANGGIASSPQLALFGEGRMPEAYVPLPDGRRIPVAMQGGGGSNVVNVTVNAEGSQVQGDSGQSEQLGRVVAKAIQEEMIRQRRPGGLLAAAA